MKPILLVVWPLHLDFPLFRFNIKRYKSHFSSIWIALSNHYQEINYTNFLMAQLPEAHFVDVKHENIDWRNDAINETLNKIKTDEPICFIEQDFLIKDDSFFTMFDKDYDFLYFKEGERVHPAFAVVKRELIEKTSRDFCPQPGGDHFKKFFEELPEGTNIENLGLRPTYDFFHLNGLSQNYMNFLYDEPYYRPNNFLYYNWKCMQLNLQSEIPFEDHPHFFQIEQAIERKHNHPEKHTYLDRFFP